MSTNVNLGRIKGAGFFTSTASSSTSVAISTIAPTNITPLVGDSIMFPNGDVRRVTAKSSTTITCGAVVANIRGAVGVGANPNLLINSNFAINQRNGYIFRGTYPFYSDAGLTNQIGTTDARVGYVPVQSISGNAANITISYTPDNGSSWTTGNGYVALSACTSGYAAAGYTVDRLQLTTATGIIIPQANSGITLTAGNTNAFANQRLENGFNIYKGKTVTFSIKIDGVVYHTTGTIPTTIPSSTFGLPAITAPNASATSIYLNSSGILFMQIGVQAGKTIAIDWVKLEVGDVATEYTPPLIAEELLKCYRYYKKYLAITTYSNRFGLGVAYWSTTRVFVPFMFIVPMRTTPTFSYGGNWRITTTNITKTDITLAVDQQNREGCAISATSASGGLTSGSVLMLSANNDTEAYLAFDAEL